MKRFFLGTITLVALAMTGCETHHHDHDRDHARWNHHDGDYDRWRNSGGYPEHERVYQPPVPVYREYPYPDYQH